MNSLVLHKTEEKIANNIFNQVLKQMFKKKIEIIIMNKKLLYQFTFKTPVANMYIYVLVNKFS